MTKFSGMCGRYDNLIAREAYRGLYKTMRLPASNFPPRYNIPPTDQVPIVRVDPRDQTRELVMRKRQRPDTRRYMTKQRAASGPPVLTTAGTP